MNNQNKFTKQQKDCLDRINNLYNDIKQMSEKKEIEIPIYVTDDIDYILDLFNNFTNDPEKKTSSELLSFLSSESKDVDKCPLVYLISKDEDTKELYYVIIINYEGKLHLATCSNLNAMCLYLADKSEFEYNYHIQMFTETLNQINTDGERSSQE